MTAVCVICSSILSDVNLGGSSPHLDDDHSKHCSQLVSKTPVLLTTYLLCLTTAGLSGSPPVYYLLKRPHEKEPQTSFGLLFHQKPQKPPPNAANPVKLARAIPLVHIKNPHVTLQARETVVLALYLFHTLRYLSQTGGICSLIHHTYLNRNTPSALSLRRLTFPGLLNPRLNNACGTPSPSSSLVLALFSHPGLPGLGRCSARCQFLF